MRCAASAAAGLLAAALCQLPTASAVVALRALAANAAGAKSQAALKEVLPCDCSNCVGQRLPPDADGASFGGFQCFPRAGVVNNLGDCKQRGNSSAWVVETAETLSYDRFCVFTCKPLMKKSIAPQVDCLQLSLEEVKALQTPSGNGKATVYLSSPMTHVETLAAAMESAPQSAGGAPSMVRSAPAALADPIAELRAAFQDVRKKQLDVSGEEEEEQKEKKAGPACDCKCTLSPEERMRTEPVKGGGDFPRPAVVALPKFRVPGPMPPMPPPPPAALPPPMPVPDQPPIASLPGLPSAPLAILAPLPTPMAGAPSGAVALGEANPTAPVASPAAAHTTTHEPMPIAPSPGAATPTGQLLATGARAHPSGLRGAAIEELSGMPVAFLQVSPNGCDCPCAKLSSK